MRKKWAWRLAGLVLMAMTAGVARGQAPKPSGPAPIAELPTIDLFNPPPFEVVCPDPVFRRAIEAEGIFQMREQTAGLFAQLTEFGPPKPFTLVWSASDFRAFADYLKGGVPTEICRALLKNHTPKSYSPWLVSGLPEVLFAEPSRREKFDAECRRRLGAGEALPLKELFARRVPERELPHAQCYSVAAFLATLPSRAEPKGAGPESVLKRFLVNDDDAQSYRPQPSLDDAPTMFAINFGFKNADELQAAWTAWLKTPESRSGYVKPKPKSPTIPPTDVGGARNAEPRVDEMPPPVRIPAAPPSHVEVPE